MYCTTYRKWVSPCIFCSKAKMLRISATLGELCFEMTADIDDEPESCDIFPCLDPETLLARVPRKGLSDKLLHAPNWQRPENDPH